MYPRVQAYIQRQREIDYDGSFSLSLWQQSEEEGIAIFVLITPLDRISESSLDRYLNDRCGTVARRRLKTGALKLMSPT